MGPTPIRVTAGMFKIAPRIRSIRQRPERRRSGVFSQLSEVRGALVRSPNMIIKRAKFVELILTLSILAGCSSDKVITDCDRPTADAGRCRHARPRARVAQGTARRHCPGSARSSAITPSRHLTNDRGAPRQRANSERLRDARCRVRRADRARPSGTSPVHCGPRCRRRSWDRHGLGTRTWRT
jgi:hypothetical protein